MLLMALVMTVRRAASPRPSQRLPIEVDVSDKTLHVRLRGLLRALALRSSLDIPLKTIVGMERMSKQQLTALRPTLRLLGTSVPGVLSVGLFGTPKHREFWYLARWHEDALV